MPYVVTWLPNAIDELANVYVTYPSRTMVSQAANAIDVLLARAPGRAGRRIDRDRRILFRYPLEVTYRVDDLDQRVFVLDVRHL